MELINFLFQHFECGHVLDNIFGPFFSQQISLDGWISGSLVPKLYIRHISIVHRTKAFKVVAKAKSNYRGYNPNFFHSFFH